MKGFFATKALRLKEAQRKRKRKEEKKTKYKYELNGAFLPLKWFS